MGSNQPIGDVWELLDNDNNSQNYGRKFRLDFSFIESNDIKKIVKSYIWMNYKTGNRTINKLYGDVARFKIFNKFTSIHNITNFKEMTNNDISMFLSFLKTRISDRTKKPLSYAYQKQCLDAIKSIIHWCQIHTPNEVPQIEIFTGSEYTGVNRKLKIDFIPDDIVCKINEALITEENPYVKYGIIILQTTGMRLGDMLKLTIDCVKPHLISGYTLTWYDHKNRKERPPMPIPNECAIAIEKLIDCTKELRKQADNKIQDYLFIHKPKYGLGADTNTIMNIGSRSFQKWLNKFIEKNGIYNANGELYNLTSHQFRRTLATDMLSKDINIKVIQEVLGHASVFTTKLHYADVKDKERAETFKNIGIIGNINKVDATVISDKMELQWFNANKDKGARMCDGYCTKPLIDGKICDRLLKRQKCYTCSRYITTPEHLEAHKSHLKELEQQLEENIYGKHYAEHFIPTMEVLKVIISRLEELKDAYREVAVTSN